MKHPEQHEVLDWPLEYFEGLKCQVYFFPHHDLSLCYKKFFPLCLRIRENKP